MASAVGELPTRVPSASSSPRPDATPTHQNAPNESDAHSRQAAKSASLLAAAREKARQTRDYDSIKTRNNIIQTFRAAFDDKQPYGWQVDVAEAILLGLDCTVIAGTGAGKTMPFAMPLLADKTKEKMVLIISPLNELEQDQARRFKKLGLTATAVNGEVYNTKLHQELIAKKHRVMLTSPEMCLEHTQFSQLLRSPEFMKNIAAIIIDEAHCISQWGDDFRKKYAELEKLRSFIALHVPLLATSATLPPLVLEDVQCKLAFNLNTTYLLNLGNNRPNITPLVYRMKGAASSYPLLDFLVHGATPDTTFQRAIIFVETRDLAQRICEHLRKSVHPDVQEQINFLHSMRTRNARRRVMRDFRCGKINILCATEAAGMGMDIPNLDLIVHFMVPKSLSIWTQRAGRCGRSGGLAFAILFVEPSVFETTKPRKKRKKHKGKNKEVPIKDEGCEGPQAAEAPREYKKKVEQGMRDWVETPDCRRIVANRYFNNPPSENDPQFPCCDNCILKRQAQDATLSAGEQHALFLLESISQHENDHSDYAPTDDEEPDEDEDEDEDDRTTSHKIVRRGPHRAECRSSLVRWRITCWRNHFAKCSFSEVALLPDKILTKLAGRGHIKTLADMKKAIPEWPFIDDYGEEILRWLAIIDDRHTADKEADKKAKAAKRALQSAENKATREEQRRVKLRLDTAARNAARNPPQGTYTPTAGPSTGSMHAPHPYAAPHMYAAPHPYAVPHPYMPHPYAAPPTWTAPPMYAAPPTYLPMHAPLPTWTAHPMYPVPPTYTAPSHANSSSSTYTGPFTPQFITPASQLPPPIFYTQPYPTHHPPPHHSESET